MEVDPPHYGGGVAWSIGIGDELRRREVHQRHGGSQQDGMTRAAGSENLMLFTSASGLRYGYSFDGWKSDGTFHYTGRGQTGDQVFKSGNAALRDHVARGLRPRLFEEVRRSIVRYLGEFRLASDRGYYEEEAPDRDGELRKVIVFRLLPVEAEQPPAGTTDERAGEISVRDLPVEAYEAETFRSSPRPELTAAERREAALVHRYAESVTCAGGHVTRKEISHHGLARRLYTDLYDTGRMELVEAKSSASRHHVRLAIGQLLDYRRHVEHESLAVLLPSDPGADLLELLHGVGITCLYEDEQGRFIRRAPGQ